MMGQGSAGESYYIHFERGFSGNRLLTARGCGYGSVLRATHQVSSCLCVLPMGGIATLSGESWLQQLGTMCATACF